MYREILRVPTQFGMRSAQAIVNGDTLVLQFPAGTSPCWQRHLKAKLIHLYRKRCAKFGIIFECWRDCKKLHIQLKKKQVTSTCLNLRERALSSHDKRPRFSDYYGRAAKHDCLQFVGNSK